MNAAASKFVTCRCQCCDNGIEFDASDFAKDETRTVLCPHCELETILYVPPIPTPPAPPKKTTPPPVSKKLSPPMLPAATPSRPRINRSRIAILTAAMFGLTVALVPTVFLICTRLTVQETEARRQAQFQQQSADNLDEQVNHAYEAAPGARAGAKRYEDEADALASERDVGMLGGFVLAGFCCLIWVPGTIYLFVTG